MSGENDQSKATEFAEIPSVEQLKQAQVNAAKAKAAMAAEGAGEPESTETPTTPTEPELPEKFQGKTMADVIQSYENLEAQLGRQAQEMGTLRQLNDQLLELPRATGGAPASDEPPELTADEVLNDPNVIDQRAQYAASKAADPVNSRVDQLEAQMAMSAFEQRHPTYTTDQADPAFQQYVNESPYRSLLAQKLVERGDLGAAEELWTGWEEQKRHADAAAENNKPDADTEATATAMATSGGDGSAPTPKPISRQELARIKIEEEERYYSPEFQAYVAQMYHKKLVK